MKNKTAWPFPIVVPKYDKTPPPLTDKPKRKRVADLLAKTEKAPW